MYKRLVSIALVLVMVIGLLPGFTISFAAASEDDDISNMNALDALGIDTSVPPEGFDPDDTDNPYGKDIVPLATVWELYTIGLTNKAVYASNHSNTVETYEDDSQGNLKTFLEDNSNGNTLRSTLFGNDKGAYTKASDVLGNLFGTGELRGRSSVNISNGTTTQWANFVRVGNGTNGSSDNGSGGNYMTSVVNRSTELDLDGFKFALSSVASGNFDGNRQGKKAQTVMVYTTEHSANGGLYLRFGDAAGTYGTSAIELIPTTKKIGNPTLKDSNDKYVEDFAANPYQLKNYLQVATGDWNNDGVDEVAVYVPEYGYSRLLIYKFEGLGSDKDSTTGLYKPTAYTNSSRWTLVWSYYFSEGDVVSNMVSFTSGDVNKDGVDDLAATWGYYYGPSQNKGSRAVVMFGASGTGLFKKSQEFSLTYGNSNIVRASFAFGDLAGSGEPCLILAGQSDSDLQAGNVNTRYVALYNWNGTQFTYAINKNFDLFATDDNGNLINAAMARTPTKVTDDEGNQVDKYIFYSSPLCVANTAVISQGITQNTSLLYFDSLLIKYGDNGLEIAEAWDTSEAMQANTSSPKSYVEYDAVSGDITGQIGAGVLITMQQTIGDFVEISAPYQANGLVPVYRQGWYFLNWWYRLWGKKTYFWYFANEWVEVHTMTSHTVSVFEPGKTYFVAVHPNEDDGKAHYIGEMIEVKDGDKTIKTAVEPGYIRTETDVSMAICLANTDNDTSYMEYSGNHYFLYSDPNVLAALASPPYFSDLLDRDDLSGNYAESTTSYSSTTGSGSGDTQSTTLTVGAYVSFEHEFEVFGVTVAKIEAEATVTAGFTWETEKTSTLEQTISYNATAGEDMIALYSIPMEVFEYITYTPDGDGGFTKIVTTVNIPHEASVRLMSLDEYESIAADYDILPRISNNVFLHELGDPTTYPKPNEITGDDDNGYKYNSYNVIAQYKGTPSRVGYSSSGGGASITQEISMSSETNSAFTTSGGLETKAGAGPGNVVVGIVAGVEGGAGQVTITTEGSSFSGDLQNMPIEAQEFGYAMNWRIFAYNYKDSKMNFPVVSYIVSDITMPPKLPGDFRQSVEETTDTEITLTWSYDKTVAGFEIYRFYEFPEGTGSSKIVTIPFSAATYDAATGTYTFKYTDSNLSPYTDYLYQIQTIGTGTQNNKSIYSEPISVRTRSSLGDPIIELRSNDLEGGKLLLYPDTPSEIEVTATMKPEDVARNGKYNSISYQWQKLVDGNWEDIRGASGPKYTFMNTSASDPKEYRCRLNIIYYDGTSAKEYYISAYSQPISTTYSKRTSTGDLSVSVVDRTTLTAEAKLWSANTGHTNAPRGTVTFTVNGILASNKTYYYSKTVELIADGSQRIDGVDKNITSASISLEGLEEGVYMVSYTYSGNRYFKSFTLTDSEIGIVGEGSAYQLGIARSESGKADISFTYGDKLYPTVTYIYTSPSGSIKKEDRTSEFSFAYSADGNNWTNFTSASKTPSVGTYTMRATHKVTDEVAATQSFTVKPREITIRMPEYTDISPADVTARQPVAELAEGSSMAEDETFAMDSDSENNTSATIRLGYKAYNSAGTQMALNASTPPGKYTIIACKSSSSSTQQSKNFENYDITFNSGKYTIIGSTYEVSVKAEKYTDSDGSRVVGTANIKDGGTKARYSAGSSVTLVATPDKGYKVQKWVVEYKTNHEVKYNDKDNKDFGGAEDLTSLYLTTEAQNIEVTVYFERAHYELRTSVSGGGTIECDDKNFSSGSYAYYNGEFNFTAIPAEGYHFSRWIVYAASTSYPAGQDNGDGSNTLSFTMGTADTTIQAVFVRDNYSLTLGGNIRAWYMKPGQTTGDEPVKTYIASGSSIPGSSVITVEPKLGYSKSGNWIVNGREISESGDGFTLSGESLEFALSENTSVSLDTTRGKFSVSASADNDKGQVTIAVDGAAKEGDSVSEIPGGSRVTFTAKAKRGYVFDCWLVGGKTLAELTELEMENISASTNADGSALLTIANLDKDKEIRADFAPNRPLTFTASVNNASRGTLSYTIRDIYGDIAIENAEYDEPLTLYNGESVRLTVTPAAGNMVERWVVDGKSTATSEKYKDFSVISSDMTVEVHLKSSTGYKVYYSSDSGHGTIIAKADGKAFDSGDILSGGAEVVLTATPAEGYMVEKWTRIVGINSTAEEDIKDESGAVLTDTIYRTYLDGHYQYIVYFTELTEHNVSTSGINGVTAEITYVTPVTPSDDGTVDGETNYNVRDGGTVRIRFIVTDNSYATDATYLQQTLRNCGDAVTVTEHIWGKEYTAEIRGIKEDLDISTCDPFYTPVTTISYGPLVKSGEDSGHGSVEAELRRNDKPSFSLAGDINGSAIVYRDGMLVLSAVPDPGYKFVSWTIDGREIISAALPAGVTLSGRTLTLDVSSESNESYEVKALFELAGDRITFSAENHDQSDLTVHGTVSAYSIATDAPVLSGAKFAVSSWLTFTAVPDPGYHVEGWYRNGVREEDASGNTYSYYYDVTQPDPGADIVVKFIRDSYTVSYSATNGLIKKGEIVKTGSELIMGDTVLTLTAVANEGYKFVRWTVNGESAGESETLSLPVTGDSAIVAVFEPYSVKYTVIYSAGTGGTLLATSGGQAFPSGSQRAAESTIAFTATPSAGYQVKRWVVNGAELPDSSEMTSYSFGPLLADLTVLVEFEVIPTYTISLSPGMHGTITAKVNGTDRAIENGVLTVKRHDLVVLTAKPSQHYAFVAWSGDLSGTAATLTIDDVRENMSISATFTAAELVSFTVNKGSGGGIQLVRTVSDGEEKFITATVGTTVEIVAGSDVTIIAEPDSGKMLKSWTVNGATADNISNTLWLTNLLSDTSVVVDFEDYKGYELPSGSSFITSMVGRLPDDTSPETEIRDRGTVTFKLRIKANYVLTSLTINGCECLVDRTTEYETENVLITPNSDGTYNVIVRDVRADFIVDATEYKLKPEEPGTPDDNHDKVAEAAENQLSGTVMTTVYEVSMTDISDNPLGEEDADKIIRTRGGVDLYLPYPAGITYETSEGYEFVVAHLITTGPNAGTIEYLVATPTPDGLKVTVTSLSPFAVSYAPVYRITFDAATNGGSCDTAYLSTKSNGQLLSLPVASKAGHSFKGWFTEADGGTQVTTSTVFSANTTVYAQFTPTSSGGGGGGGIPGGGGGGAGGGTAPKDDYVKVTVNGKEYNIGTESSSDTATVLTIDSEKFEELIGQMRSGSSLVIPVSGGKDTSVLSLALGNIEGLAAKNASLTVGAGGITYSLDCRGIDTDAVLKALGAGNSGEIELNISIAKSGTEIQAAAKRAVEAGGATVVVMPIEFTITASYQGKAYEITTYSTFMTRSIEITAEQAARITTAIVYNADGTSYHTPTVIRRETTNGQTRYFADIHSLHDSTYVLISSRKSFADTEGKWYKDNVNEMASRKILGGREDGLFHGGDYITRAEFATIVIRALGLESLKSNAASRFEDVSRGAWYYNNIGVAYEYGIIGGQTPTIFSPTAYITRQDAMLIIQRACSIAGLEEGGKDYSNISGLDEVSAYALDAVLFNLKTGLIQGDENGYVNAKGNITRAETATIVLRMMKMSGLFS
jgi:hypothetical protein